MAVIDNLDIRRSPLVTLTGEVGAHGIQRMKDVLSELLDCGCASPRVDLAGVSFMDSQGLFALLRWCQQFREMQGDLEVVFVNPTVRRIFEVAGHAEFIHRSEDRAVPPLLDRQPVIDCFAAAGDWEVCSFSVAAKLESCKIVRDRISKMTANMSFSAAECADAKLAVGEATSNAIRHGCRERPWELVTVRCLATDLKLVVDIHDPGSGFNPESIGPLRGPEGLSEGGMGLACMRQCVDEVVFDFSSGTTVRLVKFVKS